MPKPNRNVPPTVRANLLDQTFGEWTVIGFAGRAPNGSILWLCRCSCGRVRPVQSGNLRSGQSPRCRKCGSNGPRRKHGALLARDPLCRNWCVAKQEGLCRAWQNLDTFTRDMGPKPPRARLARRDASKPHSPKNSYWHTRQDTIIREVEEQIAYARPATKAAEKKLRTHLANCTTQNRYLLLKRARGGEPIFRWAALNRRFGLPCKEEVAGGE